MRHASHIPERAERIAPSERTWAGVEEIVLRVVLQSPDLFAPNVRGITYRTMSRVKYNHQLRQIRRKERKHEHDKRAD